MDNRPRRLAGPGVSPPPEGGGLRHGLSQVKVSSVAAQWYCELKIDLALRHPEIADLSPAISEGSLAHEQLSAGASLITAEDLEEAARAGRDILLQESRFQATLDGVPVVGVPDLVRLRGRRCELILEMKFSRRPDLFTDRAVQALTYGLLVGSNGYEMEGALCVVGVVPSNVPRSPEETKVEALRRQGLLGEILESCEALADRSPLSAGPGEPKSVRRPGFTLHAFDFDARLARDYLDWAFDYWLNLRDPLPTPHGAKCRRCPYNAAGVCARARSRPHPFLRVERGTADGRPFVHVRWGAAP